MCWYIWKWGVYTLPRVSESVKEYDLATKVLNEISTSYTLHGTNVITVAVCFAEASMITLPAMTIITDWS